MPYKKHPLLNQDVLELPLLRRTKAKLAASCINTLQQLIHYPVWRWRVNIVDGLDKEEEKEIIDFLKEHKLDHRLK